MSDEAIGEFQASLQEVLAFNPDELIRTGELGSRLDFRPYLDLFKSVIELFRRLDASDFAIATESQIHELIGVTNNVRDAFTSIKDFDSVGISDPEGERTRRVEYLASSYEEAKRVAGPTIALAFAWSGGIDLDAARREAATTLGEIRESAERVQKDLEARLARAEEVLSAIRGKAAELGVAEHAILFDTAAKDFATTKKKWLSAVWVAAGVGIGLAVLNAWWVLKTVPEGIGTGAAIQISVAKLVLFSFAYYVLVWVVRMYRAAAHNEVVNQHRFLALSTFDKFVAATSDESTKQAVLLRTTESIFGHQTSGFSEPGRGEGGGSRLMEIIRGLPPRTESE